MSAKESTNFHSSHAAFQKGQEQLNRQHLETCYQWFRQKSPGEAGAVLVLLRFLRESGQIVETASLPSFSRTDTYVHAFITHLQEVRGCVPSTVRRQGQIATEFLTWLRWEDESNRLSLLTTGELEGFVSYHFICE